MVSILKKITATIPEEKGIQKSARKAEPIDIIPLIKKEFFVIAEVKKGSPSKGIIRQPFNPIDIARTYEKGGASAISVLTEKHFFYGNQKTLSDIKKETHIPVLRKDFLIYPYQITESYNLGADFILLIAACLNDTKLETLYQMAESLGMHVLVEIHDRDELKRVLKINPKIIGINNRDLNTFSVDIRTSFHLKKMIPEHIHVISESGIQSQEDIIQLKKNGFAGALIGESLLKQENPGNALRRLIKG